MRLRVGDGVTVQRAGRAFTGTVIRLEADGFWIGSPDGMSYRFAVSATGASGDAPMLDER